MLLRTFAFALLVLVPLAGAPANPAPAPLIGINMAIGDKEATENVSMSTRSTYVDAVVKAGGVPIVIPPVLSEEHVARYVDLADGFVFVGGPDIDPARYGQDPHETWNPINPRREEFDFLLMERILESEKPILAVCLGAQELNVARGGTLIQDIPDLTDSTIDHRPRQPASEHAHPVIIEEGTLLHRLLGTTELGVNSMHHQAADEPGEGMIVSARAPDGIIEAIEIPSHPFALGVQWHPERLTHEEPHLRIFLGLVDAAREARLAEEDAETIAAE